MNTMKKLLILSALFIFGCSSNDTILQDAITLNSFNNNPAPLLVLDGVIISIISLDTIAIAPSSIAEVYVLKEEKATDKYGQKGKHGVIEVITKKSNN
jgi:uncharacterized lipoprotein YajG